MMRMTSPLCVDLSHSGEEEGGGLDSHVDEVIHAGLPDPLCIIFLLFFALLCCLSPAFSGSLDVK